VAIRINKASQLLFQIGAVISLLDDKVRSKIRELLRGFEEWLKSEDAKAAIKDRSVKFREIRTLLSEENIDGLTESDIRKIIALLWAYNMWTNKFYAANRVLQSKDIEGIRSELRELLYGRAPFPQRYDRFSRSVRGLGPSGLTEMLAFFNPQEYGIWNDKSRKALEFLGLSNILPTRKYKITGQEYEKINKALKMIYEEIKPALEKVGMAEQRIDLTLVDLFLYYVHQHFVYQQKIIETAPDEEQEDYDFDHDEIVDKLVETGNGLGFEAVKEEQIARGARVDVIWRAKIANLGVVSYVFEVHRGGSIDSLILNLQRAKNDPTVQKLVVVASKANLKKIQEEVSSLSEDFRKSLTYWEVKDVERAYNLLNELIAIISRLELVKLS
jgi:hypothetical protein